MGAETAIPSYDYRQLNQTLIEIATRRWKGKRRTLRTFQIRLMVDNDTPYGTIVAVMDAVRCPLPDPGQAPETCLFPSAEEAIKQAPEPEDQINGLYDPDRVAYDPDRHALFHDIIFARL